MDYLQINRAVEIPCPTCPTGTFSGQVENFYLLGLVQIQNMNKVKTIVYIIFHILIIITSSHVALKTVWIQFSWLLKKPADLDLHCLQES